MAVRIGRFEVTIPATPDNGPAFPGKPEHQETRMAPILIPNPIDREISNQELVDYFSTSGRTLVTSTLATGELETVVTQDQGNLTGRVVADYRKKGGELYFYDAGSFVFNGSPSSYTAYGYCYQARR